MVDTLILGGGPAGLAAAKDLAAAPCTGSFRVDAPAPWNGIGAVLGAR
jgi:uncharacterized protein with NAD-binding domain and iron-sulfur cluster